MVEEPRGAFVERGDLVHVVVAEDEVEHIEILRHTAGVGRLGDDDDSALDHPAEGDLRDGLAVLRCDAEEQLVGEESVPAVGEWSPRFDLHTFGREDLLVVDALVERVVVTNNSSRGMPDFAIAAPTASSFSYAAAVSIER